MLLVLTESKRNVLLFSPLSNRGASLIYSNCQVIPFYGAKHFLVHHFTLPTYVTVVYSKRMLDSVFSRGSLT